VPDRKIRWDAECDKAAEALGGYEVIDESLDTYFDALCHDPTGFPKVECAWGSIRYIRTKPVGDAPALTWYFVIEPNGDVTIAHVETYPAV
jgi:hypothetical protein